MPKIFKTIKNYYKLVGVPKRLIFFEFVLLLVPSLLSIVSPILSANVITDITVYDYSKAMIELSLDFAIIAVTSILYFFYYLLSKKTRRLIILNLHEYVYMNIKSNKNISNVNSAILSGIWDSADFNKDLLYKICFFIKSLIILGIIIYFELVVGFAIIAISIITFLLLRLSNKKIQKLDYELSTKKQVSLELFNNIQKGVKIENNANLENSMKDKYFDFVDNSVSTSNKIAFFYSINNNFIALILKTTTFLFTIYLISLVKTTTLTLSLYLTLTPYLSSSAENLIAFFELFSEIGNTDNTLKEFDALKFQSEEKNNEEDIKFQNFNLCFSKVGFKNGNNKKLNQIDLYLPFKSSTLFVGEANCGKREIYLMLKREKKATYGSILIDNKNIYDMNEHQFLNIFYFVTKKPFFYNLSIYENLYLVCQNRNKIFKAIKTLELKQKIDKLENGINTVISEKFNEKLLFYLGLARAYLSEAKIICIYETPPNLNKDDKQFLCKLLKTININCTVIIFCHDNTLGFDFNNVIYIESLNTKNAN